MLHEERFEFKSYCALQMMNKKDIYNLNDFRQSILEEWNDIELNEVSKDVCLSSSLSQFDTISDVSNFKP